MKKIIFSLLITTIFLITLFFAYKTVDNFCFSKKLSAEVINSKKVNFKKITDVYELNIKILDEEVKIGTTITKIPDNTKITIFEKNNSRYVIYNNFNIMMLLIFLILLSYLMIPFLDLFSFKMATLFSHLSFFTSIIIFASLLYYLYILPIANLSIFEKLKNAPVLLAIMILFIFALVGISSLILPVKEKKAKGEKKKRHKTI